jgi:ABC-type multidrug transport system ATPase subunit
MKIEVKEVTKAYGRVKALDRVSLVFDPGQIISVLGPNGAGKTTLLRCLCGIAGPDWGAVYFDQQKFRRDQLALRRRIHFLPDFPLLFLDQTVLRNVSIILRLFDNDGERQQDRVVELLREFDMLPLATRPVATLSRGQAYKCALIGLVAADPEVWLLDEPFASGMDPLGIDVFKREAQSAAKRGRTILYSTQLLDIAQRFSDRACIIHNGAIHAFDTLQRLGERAADKDNALAEMFRQLRESGQ